MTADMNEKLYLESSWIRVYCGDETNQLLYLAVQGSALRWGDGRDFVNLGHFLPKYQMEIVIPVS